MVISSPEACLGDQPDEFPPSITVRSAVKRNLALCLVLLCSLILYGCAGQPDSPDSQVEQKYGLFLVKGTMICQEAQSSKMWQFGKAGPFSSMEEAEWHVKGLKLGSYDDWRLPTKSELFNLFYIHYWKNNGDCDMNRKGDFWAVSEGRAPSPGHWEDYFLCGPEYKFVKSIKGYGYVRAICP